MRELYSAKLIAKTVLSEQTQCFHLEFAVDDLDMLPFEPGQFISCVADDTRGKQQTRAYSLACAPQSNRFELCVNRVNGGFFSNRLCDLHEGESLAFHGPHGVFVLEEPTTHTLLLASDTGVAPMRGFVQHLFPLDNASAVRPYGQVTLVCAAVHEADLYYREEFERVAAAHTSFRYLPTLADADPTWAGATGPLEPQAHALASALRDAGESSVRAYICGLHQPVKACREALRALGWDRKQITSERYD